MLNYYQGGVIVVIKIHWRIRLSEGLLMSQIGLVFHLLAFVLVVKIRIYIYPCVVFIKSMFVWVRFDYLNHDNINP